jgi:hypothetical protein
MSSPAMAMESGAEAFAGAVARTEMWSTCATGGAFLSATNSVGAAELKAGRVGGGDQRRKLSGQRIDLAERIADRRIIVVGIEPGHVHREHTVVGGVGNVERTRAGIGLDHVVQPAGDALDLREGDGLMRRAGVLDVDDRVVGAAGEQQIPVRSNLQ